MNPEAAILQSIILYLWNELPAALAEAQAQPFVYLDRSTDGVMAVRTDYRELPPMQEIWSQQHPRLNFPALLVHYQDSQYTEESDECTQKRSGVATYIIDLAITSGDPELLTWLWFRYASVIQSLISKATSEHRIVEADGQWYDPNWTITGQRVIENGPYESLYLRRGTIELSIEF